MCLTWLRLIQSTLNSTTLTNVEHCLQERRLYTKKHSFFTCVILPYPKRLQRSTFLRIYKWGVLVKISANRKEEVPIKNEILQGILWKVTRRQMMTVSSKWICSINIVFIALSRIIFNITFICDYFSGKLILFILSAKVNFWLMYIK